MRIPGRAAMAAVGLLLTGPGQPRRKHRVKWLHLEVNPEPGENLGGSRTRLRGQKSRRQN